jgi:hypothetical protein
MSQFQIQVDTTSASDDLGRGKFAHHLLQLIQAVQADEGAVVALEGEWGSGKTWILRQTETLCNKEEEASRPVFVWFSPWMVSGASEIVEAFLIQLASEFAENSPSTSGIKNGAQIASKLIDYTRVLSTVKHLAPLANVLMPGSGLLFEAIGTAAGVAGAETKDTLGSTLDRWKSAPEKLSLSASRRQVVELLKQAERRIVVVVDDLDRLPPSDLASMIQAIKAVADFPNLVYLLAYDPKTTAAALKTALRLPGDEGRKYLEKIVQLPLHIPEVPAFRMQAFAKARFKQVLRPLVHEASDITDLDEALPRAAALMQTPRDVVRLCTRLQVIAPPLACEVNLADLLLAETLGFKVPAIIDFVDQHRPVILTVGVERYDEDLSYRGHLGDPVDRSGINDDRADEQNEQKILRGLKSAVGKNRHLVIPVSQAMAFLFDKARESAFVTVTNASRLRIQRLKHWNRWRSAFADVEFFENSEVLAWLANPAALKESRAFADPLSFSEFCVLAADLCDEAPTVDAVAFTAMLVDASRSLGEGALLLPSHAQFSPLAALQAVLRKEGDQEKRSRAIDLLLDGVSVWLSFQIVFTAHLDAFDRTVHPGDRLLTDDARVRTFDQRWTELAIADLNRLEKPDPDRAGFTLASRIVRLDGDRGHVREAIAKIVRTRQGALDILFSGDEYCNESIQHGGGWKALDLISPTELLDALPRSQGFEESHRSLVTIWRRQSEKQLASDDPSP